MTAARPLSGFRLVPGYLDRPAQEALLAALRSVFARAPLYTPRMPKSGKPLSVRMTNCGPLGWVTDEAGYRYQPLHQDRDEHDFAAPVISLSLGDTCLFRIGGT